MKIQKKIEVSDKEIDNLLDAEFKTLAIRMLTEMAEFGHKIEEQMKAMQREIKKNVQGATVKGSKLGLRSTLWSRRKKETFNQNRMKKQEFKKVSRGLGTSRTILNIPKSKS